MSTWTLGRFVVRLGLRTDNPAWPLYLVYLKDKLIGKAFSVPDFAWCEHLERLYGYETAPAEVIAEPKRALHKRGINGIARSRRTFNAFETDEVT